MKSTVLALAAALAFLPAAPAALAEEGGSTRVSPADLEERFYRAFYAENGLRDFAKAAEMYAEVHVAARAAGRKDLAVKALLGRARCTRTMGKPEETKAALAGVLEMDPENEEAKTADAADAATTPDEDLRNRISHLVLNGLTGNAGDPATSARELRLLGDRCLPRLAEALRDRDLGTVEAAATYLASLDSPGAREILLRAMKNPEVVFRAAVARAACEPKMDGTRGPGHSRPFSVDEVPVLAAAAEFADTELREGVVNRLAADGDTLDPVGRELLARLASDPARSVRMRVYESDWSLETTQALVPILRRALASTDQEERAYAVAKVEPYPAVQAALSDTLRGLLRDPDATIRAVAFGALRSQFTEGDMAGMLDPEEPGLAAGAAGMLKGMTAWSAGTRAAAEAAIRRAIRGEFGPEFAPHVLGLAGWRGQGGIESVELIDLYAASGAPDAKAGEGALGPFRQEILTRLRAPLRLDQSPQHEQAMALLEEGVERCFDSGWALHTWVKFWSDANFPAARAWIRAASTEDFRARKTAYGAILRVLSTYLNTDLPKDGFPHLGRDLLSQDREMKSYALQLAERVPSPAAAEGLRALHGAAEGEAREKLLVALVTSAGKAAEDAVRGDLARPDVRRTALRLLVNELGFRDRRELDSFVDAGGDPATVVGLHGYGKLPETALLRGFAMDLPVARYTGSFVAEAADFLEPEDRHLLLTRALGSPNQGVLSVAARKVGELRVVDLWPRLTPLLESGSAAVRASAEQALAALKTYADLKSSFARFGKDEEAGAFDHAKSLLLDGDPVKRKGAVLALAALGDRAAIPVLLGALDDKDAGVRDAALAALERLGGNPTPK